MASPSFTTTLNLTRGRMERDIEVEVDYTFDGETLEVTEARDLTEGRGLSSSEWDYAEEAAAADCDAAFAEWQADRGEYLRDQAEDRRMAA